MSNIGYIWRKRRNNEKNNIFLEKSVDKCGGGDYNKDINKRIHIDATKYERKRGTDHRKLKLIHSFSVQKNE